ncbi:hypothetical protein [Mycolicibacterium celeriflavum]|uniref:hypothetical protein n=1 Tax=Mycolicibacterium celeriflavum TaxID=1249101 RepID=UPI003CEF3A70
MPDFSRLSRNWIDWSNSIQMANVSVSPGADDTEICFTSTDQSFLLRGENGWWTVDVVTDRGKRYDASAGFPRSRCPRSFSSGRWGSTIRDVLGVKMFDPELYALGRNDNVAVLPTEEDGSLDYSPARARLVSLSQT